MSSNILEFYVKMKDLASSGLAQLAKNAKSEFGKIQTTMESVGSHIKSGLNSMFLGAGLGLVGIFASIGVMAHTGIEKVHELHEAEAALSNTMKNMGTYSEESFEKAIKGAADLSKGILFSKTDVIDLQSQLRLVGNISEAEMQRMIMDSADMATKFHIGLGEAGNAIAKAVNNPEMLRRLAMQIKIDPAMVLHLQNLAKHGHEAQARLELLSVVEEKVGGAASAAFNADPMARYNKFIEKTELQLGETAQKVKTQVLPVFMSFTSTLLDASSALFSFLGLSKTEPETLSNEKGSINALVGSITGLNQGNGLRNTLLTDLKNSYPDLFGKIDLEKTTNSELLTVLNDVNKSYSERIALSKTALQTQSLDKEMDYTMGIIGRAQQQLDYMKKGHTGFFDTGMFSPFMEGFDNVQIRKFGFDEKSISGLQKFIDFGLKDAQRIQKDKAVLEAPGIAKQALLSKYDSDAFEMYKKFHKGKTPYESSLDGTTYNSGDNGVSSKIASGGPRTVNITFRDMVGKIEVHANSINEGLDEMEHKVEEHFLRILNSGASVQSN